MCTVFLYRSRICGKTLIVRWVISQLRRRGGVQAQEHLTVSAILGVPLHSFVPVARMLHHTSRVMVEVEVEDAHQTTRRVGEIGEQLALSFSRSLSVADDSAANQKSQRIGQNLPYLRPRCDIVVPSKDACAVREIHQDLPEGSAHG